MYGGEGGNTGRCCPREPADGLKIPQNNRIKYAPKYKSVHRWRSSSPSGEGKGVDRGGLIHPPPPPTPISARQVGGGHPSPVAQERA
jgi:hypothetical protein